MTGSERYLRARLSCFGHTRHAHPFCQILRDCIPRQINVSRPSECMILSSSDGKRTPGRNLTYPTSAFGVIALLLLTSGSGGPMSWSRFRFRCRPIRRCAVSRWLGVLWLCRPSRWPFLRSSRGWLRDVSCGARRGSLRCANGRPCLRPCRCGLWSSCRRLSRISASHVRRFAVSSGGRCRRGPSFYPRLCRGSMRHRIGPCWLSLRAGLRGCCSSCIHWGNRTRARDSGRVRRRRLICSSQRARRY